MPLVRLLYISKSTLMDGARSRLEQLVDILNQAVEVNHKRNITGALAFDGEHFVQALEGERDTVWELYQYICRDKRHTDVTLIEFREVPERMFGNWWMALGTRNAKTESLFAEFERHGSLGERGVNEMLQLLASLSTVGFDRVVNVPSPPPAA